MSIERTATQGMSRRQMLSRTATGFGMLGLAHVLGVGQARASLSLRRV